MAQEVTPPTGSTKTIIIVISMIVIIAMFYLGYKILTGGAVMQGKPSKVSGANANTNGLTDSVITPDGSTKPVGNTDSVVMVIDNSNQTQWGRSY